MAWLNTAPESKVDRTSQPTRLERMRQQHGEGYSPEMPEPCGAEHLISWLWEIGPTSSNGMGGAPISHLEIRAWQDNTGIELQAWQARLLRQLSLEYLAEQVRAAKPLCPAPWEVQQVSQATAAAEAMRRSMRQMANK